MAYSNFTLPEVEEKFGLAISTSGPLFPGVPPVVASQAVRYTLETFGQLALSVNTEKARSEWMIAPVLGEMWVPARATRSACCPVSISTSTRTRG